MVRSRAQEHDCTTGREAAASVCLLTAGWINNNACVTYMSLAHRALIDLMYNSELEFTDKLLGDWGVRTENPWEGG